MKSLLCVVSRSSRRVAVQGSNFHTGSTLRAEIGKVDPNLILCSTTKSVTTLTMNDPKRLNGWTGPMMVTLRQLFQQYAKDDNTKVLILTGKDPYYCAGVSLGDALNQPMHPKKLHTLIANNNKALFDVFLDFPKPILIAANGPAIGASVTSASLCDAMVASEKATFNVPFAALGIPPEGCSSIHFERMMGGTVAERLLKEGWKPNGAEAASVGLATEVVPHEQLMKRSQEIAEGWVREKRQRTIPGGGSVEEYKRVNLEESIRLADAFLDTPFLNAQYKFLMAKGKTGNAAVFWFIKSTRPLWSKLL